MVEDLSNDTNYKKKGKSASSDVLTADDLISGSDVIHTVEIDTLDIKGKVKVKPVTLSIVKKASRAAEGDETEISKYLIKQALIEPEMSDTQIDSMPIGLINAISNKINEISGISKKQIQNAKNL
jgi:hypothetical protein